MKPFNLQEAIEGKPIVTRDGRKVLECHYFKTLEHKYPFRVIIEGKSDVYMFTKEGVYDTNLTSHKLDLFMYEEPKNYYANVYKSHSNGICIGAIVDNIEEAKNIAINRNAYIKTIEITIP